MKDWLIRGGWLMGIGTTLSLKESVGTKKEPSEFRCKIIDITDEGIVIDYPIHIVTGKTTYFGPNMYFKASFVDKNDDVFQFKTKIIGKVQYTTVPGLLLNHPDKDTIEQVQRREYVRVRTAADVAIASVNHAFDSFTTVTTDMSGGGLSIILPLNTLLEVDDLCDIWIVVSEKTDQYHYVKAKGKIVRKLLKDSDIHTVSIEFTEISVKDRQNIIRYCFQKQREAKQKELT